MSYRILHLSDLHLETSFARDGLDPSTGSRRRSDLRAALGRAISFALEHRVDLVTVGGDLYDQDFALPEVGSFLAQQFARIAPATVLIAPGEKDPYTLRSLYALTRWPSNVHIFAQNNLSSIDIAPDLHIWGAAHPAGAATSPLSRPVRLLPGVNIMLLHASENLGPATGDAAEFRIDADAVAKAQFDMALLGHEHSYRTWPAESPRCVYPGSPEPLDLGEADGRHGLALVTIDDGGVRVEPVPFGQWRYWAALVDLTGCRSTEDAAKRVRERLLEAPGGLDERLVARIALTGTPGFEVQIGQLADEVAAPASVEYESQLDLNHNLDQLAQEQTVRGVLVRRLQARLREEKSPVECQKLRRALSIALAALDGKQVHLDEVA